MRNLLYSNQRITAENRRPAKNRHAHSSLGQVALEFTFCFIIMLLLLYGLIMAFRWAGISLAERRIDHDNELTRDINEGWSEPDTGPLRQIRPDFADEKPMGMVFNRW